MSRLKGHEGHKDLKGLNSRHKHLDSFPKRARNNTQRVTSGRMLRELGQDGFGNVPAVLVLGHCFVLWFTEKW